MPSYLKVLKEEKIGRGILSWEVSLLSCFWEHQGEVITQKGRKQTRVPLKDNPLDHIQEAMAAYRPVAVPGLPRFVGGAVGYLAYDVARSFEPIPPYPKAELKTPLFAFCITDTLLIFDNIAHTIKVIANAHIVSTKKQELRRTYQKAIRQIELIIARLHKSRRKPSSSKRRTPLKFQSNMTSSEFEKMVLRTKEYIQAGDIIQGVMSQRWHTRLGRIPSKFIGPCVSSILHPICFIYVSPERS